MSDPVERRLIDLLRGCTEPRAREALQIVMDAGEAKLRNAPPDVAGVLRQIVALVSAPRHPAYKLHEIERLTETTLAMLEDPCPKL